MKTNHLLISALLVMALPASSLHAGGDPARGLKLSVDCVDCHGEDGLGDEDNPAIAGLEEAYALEEMQKFKSGERPDEEDAMLVYVEELSDQDLADLAAYYATLEGPPKE